MHSIFLLFLCSYVPVPMFLCSYLDSNIPLNIYYASIVSGRFARTTSDINTFVTLSHRLLKKIQKQQSKHRAIRSLLNGIFGKYVTLFDIFADAAAHFIKFFSLPWIRTKHINNCLLHSLFLLFFGLFVCLFACLSGYHVIISSVSSTFVSMYLHLHIFLWVCILHYNFTMIANCISVYDLVI